MRLLDVDAFKPVDFGDNDTVPRYAILSHTWEAKEVGYHEISKGEHLSSHQGWAKIRAACRLARERSLSYVWIDTCCIDQSSHDELSTAINSMFQWYKNAEVCFAYLADVSAGAGQESLCETEFRSSRWFKRGWTLQELLAPVSVIFFSKQWDVLGSLDVLSESVNKATDIPIEVLNRQVSMQKIDFWTKLRWASRRECKMIEDEAYCLLGILDLNMTIQYGEGGKARERLIMQLAHAFIHTWPGTLEQGTNRKRQYLCPDNLTSTQHSRKRHAGADASATNRASSHLYDNEFVEQQDPDVHPVVDGMLPNVPNDIEDRRHAALGVGGCIDRGPLLPIEPFNGTNTHQQTRRRASRPKRGLSPTFAKSEGKHNCTSCQSGFSRSSDLQRHIKVKHSLTTISYACRRCEYTSKRKDKVTEHCRRIHTNEDPQDLVTTADEAWMAREYRRTPRNVLDSQVGLRSESCWSTIGGFEDMLFSASPSMSISEIPAACVDVQEWGWLSTLESSHTEHT